MKRQSQNSNRMTIVALVIFAVVLFASVPFVGDWILNEFIYPDEIQCLPEFKLEAGQPLPPAQSFFIHGGEDGEYLSDTDVIDTSKVATYPVELKSGNKTYTSALVIVDTVAPQATPVDLKVSTLANLKAEQFVTNVLDVTQVTVTFVSEPNPHLSGTQNVVVKLTDEGENVTTITATVTMVVDKQAPVISGAKDLDIYVGDTVSYRKGITVTDNVDASVALQIDNSNVDLSKPGVYRVIYSATDAAGNTATVTVRLTVRAKADNFVDPEVIYAKADAILAQFIRPDMTDRQKAEAVYVWTRRSVHLTYGSKPAGFVHEEADWLQTAYQLLNRDVAKGDCYFFFAVQKLLLQRLNIPTIDVEKTYDGHSRHYWLLVSVDGGKTYYHFDNVWSRELCLVTDAQLAAFSESCKNDPNIGYDPFIRDTSKYPSTPTQKLPASTLPWEDPAILAAKP